LENSKNTSQSSFWDLIITRSNGQWLGFRTSFHLLQKASLFFGVLMLLGLFASLAWVVARWDQVKTHRELVKAQLEIQSFKDHSQAAAPSTGSEAQRIVVSDLGGPDLDSPLLRVSHISADWDASNSEVSLKFQIESLEKNSVKLSWMSLFHNSQAMISYPAVFSTGESTLLNHEKAVVIENLRGSKVVTAKFRASSFPAGEQGAEPMNAMLLIYDNKGSLMSRKKMPVAVLRSVKK